MAAAVYRAVRDGKRLFCQAPTGVGKTISTLFPAVKAMGEGLAGQIFYLTAKTVAGRAAAGALDTMRTHGLHLKSVHLTAKEKICCLETPSCTPLSCPRALGHYDRINEALYELLTSADCLDREAVSRAAEAHRVCPFEMALDLSEWCDVIVCDYNYLFDPTVNLKRYFSEKKGDYVFLIDEAHNLPDRGRDMYTAELAKSEVLALRRQAGKGEKSLWAMLGRLNSALLALRSSAARTARPPFRRSRKIFCPRSGSFPCSAASGSNRTGNIRSGTKRFRCGFLSAFFCASRICTGRNMSPSCATAAAR